MDYKEACSHLRTQVELLNTSRLSGDHPCRQKNDEALRIEHIHSSNALSGSTLSLRETYLVVAENMTLNGKTLKEMNMAKSTAFAYDFMLTLAKEQRKLTLHDIKQIHSLVLNDEPEHRGIFRSNNVAISGSTFVPPDATQVRVQMELLLERYNSKSDDLFTRIAVLHLRFEQIHPFANGNGRTGRLLINLELIRAGYLPINVKYTDRELYYQALTVYDEQNDYFPMLHIILQQQQLQLLQNKS